MQVRGTTPVLYDNVDKAMLGTLRSKVKELDYAWKDYLRSETSDKKFERVASLTAFGDVPEIGEGADLPLDIIKPGWTVDFTHLYYAMGFRVTQIALEDDQYSQLIKAGELLAFSARYSQAKLAANVLNAGFTATTGTLAPDTNPLFYATHTLKGGGTAGNTPAAAADLSIASLTAAIIDLQAGAKLESGQMGPPITSLNLVVPPALEFIADRIVNSTALPGGNDNDRNAVKARRSINIVVEPLLTDADTWFLVPTDKSRHGLKTYVRVPISMMPPREDDAGNRLYRVRYRQSFGAEAWQNVYGVPGA